MSLVYGATHANNVHGFDLSVDKTPGRCVVFIDLDPNLRSSSESNASYHARALADGDLANLRYLRFAEPDVANDIGRLLGGEGAACVLWIELDGVHAFRVRPEWTATGLVLYVEERLEHP